jgi:DNA (cytosine-5)-methyltransferase 1
MIVGSVFSGIGMLDYGLSLAGIEHAWLCEVDPFRRTILGRRWPDARVFDDIRAVGTATASRVDVIAGGFPCKGASTAGKRNGFDHPETRLWREMARCVGELRPRYVVVENVANILAIHDGAVWGTVVGDLAALGYDTQWDCIPAAAFGAPHLRDRIIALATNTDGTEGLGSSDQWPPANWWTNARGSDSAQADSGDAGAFAADSGEGGCEGVAASDGSEPSIASGYARRFGVPVEWDGYEPAIRRWEQMVGKAPEPLCFFRGMDARAAARVERSRLSALGDGVQVQLGELVGRYLMSLEARAAA